MNKKIKNATAITYDNIEFKSKLEAVAYQTFKEAGLNPLYEPEKITLMEGFKPTVSYYTKDKRTKDLVLNSKKIIDLTYTPDFIVYGNNTTYYIELKGMVNDTFPIKRKLFRRYLENQNQNSVYFELYTKKDVLSAIQIIKDYEKDTKVNYGTS